MQSYLNLFRRHRRVLFFGMLLTFFSSFGQTFFISLTAPHLMEEFSLSNAWWGTLYSSATLLSACTLPFAGPWLDKTPLPKFCAAMLAGLGVSCLVLSLAPNVWLLLPALYGLRLTGQSLMGLTAMTTMARRFTLQRGTAISVSSLGFPLGEIALPSVAVLMIHAMGWRWSWAVYSGCVLFGLLPLVRTLLKQIHLEDTKAPVAEAEAETFSEPAREWTRGRLLRDWRFFCILPSYVALGFLATGLILYQFHIADERGWSHATMAGAFVFFGVFRLFFSLAAGPAIDRLTARLVYPVHLLPFLLGILAIRQFHHPVAAGVYYAAMGVSMGMASSSSSAMWAELYGTRHLGAIKSMTSTAAIFSTAVAPILLGSLLDRGVLFQQMYPFIAALMIVATLLAAVACRARNRV